MTRDLKKKLDRLRKLMASACQPLPQDGQDERRAAAKDDDDLFAETYLPHLARQATPEFHRVESAMMAQRDGEIRCLAAPRNHAKTTRGIIHLGKLVEADRSVGHDEMSPESLFLQADLGTQINQALMPLSTRKRCSAAK